MGAAESKPVAAPVQLSENGVRLTEANSAYTFFGTVTYRNQLIDINSAEREVRAASDLYASAMSLDGMPLPDIELCIYAVRVSSRDVLFIRLRTMQTFIYYRARACHCVLAQTLKQILVRNANTAR